MTNRITGSKTILLSCALLALVLPMSAFAANVDAVSKYAWSDQVGYVNFDQVSVENYAVTGYAWSANAGWIKLDPSNGGVLNDNAGHLSGYAWGQGLGWIDFSGVDINVSTGKFTGTATGDLVGTLTFDCATYCDVRTSWRPAHSSVGGGGGGGYVAPAASIAFKTPSGTISYAPGSKVAVEWQTANGVFTKYALSYSFDNGLNWSDISKDIANISNVWTVPDVYVTQGKFKIIGYGTDGNVLASSVSSGMFSVSGKAMPVASEPKNETPSVPVETVLPEKPPAVDSTTSGTYVASKATANTPDINTDKKLTVSGVAVSAPASPACESGSLVKGTLSAVYYCGADGKRYVFSNERVYKTWYPDFSGVKKLSDSAIASIMLGGNVTYRPGVKMVKAQTSPKVYAISRGGVLRWIPTEAVATALYGANWNKMVDYVPDAFWVNYTIGEPLGG